MAVVVQDGTSFSTSDVGLKLYKLVQNYNYSIQLPRQPAKQLGSQDLVSQDFFRQPDVELGFSYMPEPSMSNESIGQFLKGVPHTKFLNMFSGSLSSDTNFYLLIAPNQEDDALDQMSQLSDGWTNPMNLDGWSTIAFGNCFPTTYGLTYAVGTLPVVSTNYICSNVLMEPLTGISMLMPAINLTGGNNDEVGRCEFLIDPDINDPRKPLLVNPATTGSSISLQNLEVGGQPLSGTHFVQSVNMSVDLPRSSSYGLGNDFAYTRKAQLPANGSFTVSSLVSGLDSGVLTGALDKGSGYNFELVLQAVTGGIGKDMIYKIENAKLNSYNYGMGLNEEMTFDADFSFQVTETMGLKLSGSAY